MKKGGFVIITMMLILLIVTLGVISSVVLLSVGERQQAQATIQGENSLSLVEGCVEDALKFCRDDPANCKATYTLTRPGNLSCSIVGSELSPNSYQLQVSGGQQNTASMLVTLTRSSTGIIVTTWKQQ